MARLKGELQADNGDILYPHTSIDVVFTVDGKTAAKELQDIKAQISNFPTSLPANGGNADTVDGKHASDFASSTHNHDNLYANKQGVYSGIVSGGIKAWDNRNIQYTPEWYINNHPMRTIMEFKTTAAIGITGTNSMHCYLETHTPWNDSSGGYPMQIAWLDTRTPLYRWGINATTWGEWKSLGEGGGDVAGKTYVKATRTVENTGNPNSNLEVINYTNAKGGVCKISLSGGARMQIIVDGVMVLDGTNINTSDNHPFFTGSSLSSGYGELPTYPFKNNVKVVDRSSNSGARVYTAHFYVNN